VIRNHAGVITAFDGDRVMAVYRGNAKNSNATQSALRLAWIVRQINDRIQATYHTSYKLEQAIGVDTSPLFVARTGIRDNNDLVWVGRAANFAAKLCELASDVTSIHITPEVYNKLNLAAKYGGKPKRNMWTKTIWQAKGIPLYRSNWWRGF
jgi:class 3 adenylate cyclase